MEILSLNMQKKYFPVVKTKLRKVSGVEIFLSYYQNSLKATARKKSKLGIVPDV